MIPVIALHPVRRKAYITYGLIVLNTLVFLWQLTLNPLQLGQAYTLLAVVPCEISRNWLAPESFLDLFRAMFMHGSWLHLVGNMTYLWIFGRNVEDYLGHMRFFLLYILWGVAASVVHIIVAAGSCVPTIGASGAIAGVLGSFLIFYPGTRVRVMVIFFRFFPRFFDLPSLIVLGFWFVLQLVNGLTAFNAGLVESGGIAFFAHIGGFIAGMLTAFIYTMFNPPPRRVVYVE
jgi:membrane associated rhomboid family serine protease